jgi:antitoxin component YwqK of YwqJK toxin-antitoxin module
VIEYRTGAVTKCVRKTDREQREDECKSWYPGNLIKAEYRTVNGSFEGLYSCWGENGALLRRGQYKSGKEDGLWAEWDSYEHRLTENTYRDGEPWEGSFVRSANSGAKLIHLVYKNGKKVEERALEPQ